MIRFPKCLALKTPFIVAALVTPLLFGGGAQATALFSSSATVSLTITGIENVTSPGGTIDIEILGGVAEAEPFSPPFPPVVFTEGTGTGSATAVLSPLLTPPFFDDPTLLDIGDSLSITLTSSGSADSTGYAEAYAIATALMTIDNFSMTDDIEISFLLEISAAATASVDDAILEDAVGDSSIFFDTLTGSGPFVDEFIEADALFGPSGDSFDLSLEFMLVVGADDSEEVLIVADVGGFAEAIPAPGAALFLLGGVIWFGTFRRRFHHG